MNKCYFEFLCRLCIIFQMCWVSSQILAGLQWIPPKRAFDNITFKTFSYPFKKNDSAWFLTLYCLWLNKWIFFSRNSCDEVWKLSCCDKRCISSSQLWALKSWKSCALFSCLLLYTVVNSKKGMKIFSRKMEIKEILLIIQISCYIFKKVRSYWF